MSTQSAVRTLLYSEKGIRNLAHFELENLQAFGCYDRINFEGRWHTNLESAQNSARIARALKSRGIRTGDRILTVLPNCPELLDSIQAAWILGAVIIPVPPALTTLELTSILNHSGASTILTAPTCANQVWALAHLTDRKVRCISFGETNLDDCVNIDSDLTSGDALEKPFDCGPDYPALMLYTSGTTAKPKGVVLTHNNIASAMEAVTRRNGTISRETMLHVLPLTHIFGMLMAQLANRWGMQSVMHPQFDPVPVFQSIEQYGISYAVLYPSMLADLLRHPDRSQYNLATLRRLIAVGGPLPESLRNQLEHTFRCHVEQAYGISETGFIACYSEGETCRPNSVGRVCPGFELQIVNDSNIPVPPDTQGEIRIRGDSITSAYWQDLKSTRNAFVHGWFHTGDIGYIDDDGYLYIVERKKEPVV